MASPTSAPTRRAKSSTATAPLTPKSSRIEGDTGESRSAGELLLDSEPARLNISWAQIHSGVIRFEDPRSPGVWYRCTCPARGVRSVRARCDCGAVLRRYPAPVGGHAGRFDGS